MKHFAISIFIILSTINSFGQTFSQTIKRNVIHSDILNDEREISVYLPPSYYTTKQNFPVLYILDGDYNFFYVSGLLELQSAISENIPEIILVGISGKGTETYRKNCKPNIERIKDKGNADQYSDFIEKELVAFVNKNYRTADFKILAGHSVGGLFIINTVLQKPNSFNSFIAISPALWWEKNAINEVAIQTFESNPSFSSDVYVSLANEKGMGVDKFLDVAKEYKLSDSIFKFKHFPNENHNSVGLPTYIWALKDIFKTWEGEIEYFKNTTELKDYHSSLIENYGSTFNMQPSLLIYTIYVLKDKSKELEKMQVEIKQLFPEANPKFNNLLAERLIREDKKAEAKELLEKSIEEYPEFFSNYHTLSKLNLASGNNDVADTLINEAIELATKQKVRQWQLNELVETKEKTEVTKEIDNNCKTF